jgi:GT2 family glycosyltransferase
MDVTVIVPVYNDEMRITECIKAIQDQDTGFAYETIVVNDFSTDNTGALLKGFRDVTVISNDTNCGQSRCRNRGASLAKGKYLLFVDSDVVIPRNSISKAVAYMERGKPLHVKGVQGTFAIHTGFPNWSSILYNTLQHILTSSPDLSYSVNTSCLLIEREAFFDIGGFDEEIWYLEDVEFSRRAASKGILFKRNLIHFKHTKYLNISWLLKQHVIGGIQLGLLNRIKRTYSVSMKKYANSYFENNLKKDILFLFFLIGGIFYPIFIFAAVLSLCFHLNTVKSLYRTSGNIFFIFWGFIMLQLISVFIFAGFLRSRLFNTPLGQKDRNGWLKSNYRRGGI